MADERSLLHTLLNIVIDANIERDAMEHALADAREELETQKTLKADPIKRESYVLYNPVMHHVQQDLERADQQRDTVNMERMSTVDQTAYSYWTGYLDALHKIKCYLAYEHRL